MFKVIWGLKRRSELSAEEFRHHFETYHAPLAEKHFGHLMLAYRRNYINAVDGAGAALASAESPFAFDCLSEWAMKDEQAFREIQAILSRPEVAREMGEDSAKFIDGSSTLIVTTEAVERNP